MVHHVAEKIRYFRDKLGFTQTDLAKRLGISRSYVSRIEKRALEKLREAMGEG